MKATSSAERILNKKKVINDVILISVLLLLGLLVFLFIRLSRSEGTTAVVTVNGEWVAEYSLTDDGEYSINGGTNILIISDGKAYLKEASCPDKLCVNQGKISLSGERIVCLPNRVMIEITGDGDEIFSN